MEKQTCTTGFDQLSQAHTLNSFQDHDPDSTSIFRYHWETLLTPPCRDNLQSIIVDWSPSWERKENAEADLWKYYFICRASQWAWLSVIMLQFHIICLSKPHKSLMVLQGSLAIVAAWHLAKDDKPQDKFPSSAWTMKLLNLNFRLRMLIDSSELRKCLFDEGLEGRAPDHCGPGLEDAFHRSTNGST